MSEVLQKCEIRSILLKGIVFFGFPEGSIHAVLWRTPQSGKEELRKEGHSFSKQA